MYARSQFVETVVSPVSVCQGQRKRDKTPETRGELLLRDQEKWSRLLNVWSEMEWREGWTKEEREGWTKEEREGVCRTQPTASFPVRWTDR